MGNLKRKRSESRTNQVNDRWTHMRGVHWQLGVQSPEMKAVSFNFRKGKGRCIGQRGYLLLGEVKVAV